MAALSVSARNLHIALVAIVGVVIEQALMTRLEVFGVHPDALLLAALVVGIAGGAQRGAIAGFTAGLLHDVFLVSPLGLSACSYALAAYVVGLLSDESDDLVWISTALAAMGTVIALTLFILLAQFSSDISIGMRRGFAIVVVTACCNAVVAPIVVPLVRKLWRQKDLSW